MKYIISDLGEVRVGHGYHVELAETVKGKVVSAGECEMLEDGITVFGQSYGLGIRAKKSDELILRDAQEITKLHGRII